MGIFRVIFIWRVWFGFGMKDLSVVGGGDVGWRTGGCRLRMGGIGLGTVRGGG